MARQVLRVETVKGKDSRSMNTSILGSLFLTPFMVTAVLFYVGTRHGDKKNILVAILVVYGIGSVLLPIFVGYIYLDNIGRIDQVSDMLIVLIGSRTAEIFGFGLGNIFTSYWKSAQ